MHFIQRPEIKQKSRYGFTFSPLVLAISMFIPLTSHAQSQPITQLPNTQQDSRSHYFHQDHVLGTSFDAIITGVDQQQAQRAIHAAQAEIQRLDKVLSVWRDDSEISQLNQQHHIQASDDLYQVIQACEDWRNITCGAFDARLGQVVAQIQQSESTQHIQNTATALQNNSQAIKLDPNQHITLDNQTKIAPDAYAKGYIIDQALHAARQAVPELKGIMIDIGGDIRVWGKAPQATGWKIGIQDPHLPFDNAQVTEIATLDHQAIAVSGQGYRQIAEKSHLIQPKTGATLDHIAQCVVIGQCAADSDALATAIAAMPVSDAMVLVNNLDGYEAKMVFSNGDSYQSNGWSNLVELPKQTTVQQIAGATSWPTGYQAVINLNIPKINVPNYRAPYVVVWVTDANKKAVRTLAVWGKDERWINTNYVWWRRYGRQMNNLNAVAKPSRHPGQYKLNWDGKDDQGKMVAAGKYIIHIETVREHGGHSYQTVELNVEPKAMRKNLPAQVEIGAVSVEFKK